MSIFSTINVSKQGLLAQGRAIQVASNNVANVNTPGYTRQRPLFEPLSPAFLPQGFPLGGGVEVNQIQRIADAALDAQLQREKQTLAYDQGIEAGMTRLEGIFKELGGSGLTSSLSKFFAALNDLATHPEESATRETVVQTGLTVSNQLNDMDQRLVRLGTDQNDLIKTTVVDINTLATNIAAINERISQKEAGGTAVASNLRDRRQELMRELGTKIDFTSFESDDGTVSIFVGGGFILVDRGIAGSLSTSTDQSSGALSNSAYLNIFQNMDGQQAGPITSSISGGALSAAINLRDTTIESYRDDLDAFAFTLAKRMNAQHIAGYGLDDNTQRRFFVDSSATATAAGADFTSVDGAASVIGVHATIQSNSRHVAAGATSVSSAGAEPGDNANALLLAQIESSSSSFYQVGDSVSGSGSGTTQTVGGFLTDLQGKLGPALQSARRAVSQSDLVVSELEDRRGSLSGVNLDEEVTNLISYQRAYQASARVISIADGLLEQLLRL